MYSLYIHFYGSFSAGAVIIKGVVKIQHIVHKLVLVCASVLAGINNDYLRSICTPQKTFGHIGNGGSTVHSDMEQLYSLLCKERHKSLCMPRHICHFCGDGLFATDRVNLIYQIQAVPHCVLVQQLSMSSKRQSMGCNISPLNRRNQLFFVFVTAIMQCLLEYPRACSPNKFFTIVGIYAFCCFHCIRYKLIYILFSYVFRIIGKT